MKSSKTRAGAIAVVVAVLVAANWYWSPYAAIWSMRAAAARGDADAFNAHVDYERLRESLKGQFPAILAERIRESSRNGEPLDSTVVAVGSLLGKAVLGDLVDAMVRPEVVMRAMQEGRLDATEPARKPDDRGGGSAGGGDAERRIAWSVERRGTGEVVAHAARAGDPAGDGFDFVFERSGFASWKLVAIRFPAPKR